MPGLIKGRKVKPMKTWGSVLRGTLLAGVLAVWGISAGQGQTGGAGQSGPVVSGGQSGTGITPPPTQQLPVVTPPTPATQTPAPTVPPVIAPTVAVPAEVDPAVEFFGINQAAVTGLKRYGFSYFAGARAMVDSRRLIPPTAENPGTSALTTPVGPDLMAKGNVQATATDRYQLGPGDVLSIRYKSMLADWQDADMQVDAYGAVVDPVSGFRTVVRGQTLESARVLLTKTIARAVKKPEITLILKALRTMPVQVLGEAYAPGTYQVPSVSTLFNVLYAAGGPSELGSFRSIELRRANQKPKVFDLYKLFAAGDGSQDISLQPGDIVFIPAAKVLVAVKGEVIRQGIYELQANEKLTDAIRFAGGARPSGIAQKVSVQSVRPGSERSLVDASVLTGGDGAGTTIYSGDIVEVFSIRPEYTNAVTIEGAVQTPRSYAITKGMRVADLVEGARGLIPTAFPERADLYRLNPDGTQALVRVDLAHALKRDAAANIELKPYDRLVIYTVDDVRFLGFRKVAVRGAVRKPTDELYRADNMTLKDALIQAGGLTPDAYPDEAFVQRTNSDGTPGKLISANLGKLLSGDASQDVMLMDRDVITVHTTLEVQFKPDQTVTIIGAVQKPGPYQRSENMRVRDLLAVAGNVLPTASTTKAYLQRQNADGTAGPLFVINVDKLYAGDAAQNVQLEPRDKLTVLSVQEAHFTPDESVTINGAVQRPGVYQRSSNMTLRDVLELAGGPLPSAGDTFEIQNSFAPINSPFKRVQVANAVAGTDNPALMAGDVITLPKRFDIVDHPRLVTVLGAVNYPGPYLIQGNTDRVSSLIQRAGGFTPTAFPVGAQFTRDPKWLSTPLQDSLRPKVIDTFKLIAADEYKRASAVADLERLRMIFAPGSSLSGSLLGSGSVTTNVQTGTSVDQAIATSLMSQSATMARQLGPDSLTPTGNMNARLAEAVRSPGGTDDLILMDGDVIVIPERPTTVSITGAVVVPSAVLFDPRADLRYYVERAGGLTNDADFENIIVVRATGALIRYKRDVKVELGDNIVVPTKVMAQRLRDRQTDLQAITGAAASAGVTLALIRAITR